MRPCGLAAQLERKRQRAQVQAKNDAWTDISTQVSNLRTTVDELRFGGGLDAATATSSHPDDVVVSVTGTPTPSTLTFTVTAAIAVAAYFVLRSEAQAPLRALVLPVAAVRSPKTLSDSAERVIDSALEVWSTRTV